MTAPDLSLAEAATVARFEAAPAAPESWTHVPEMADVVAFLQGRRRDTLRALRASTNPNADYWRWQGHAELSRQVLERLGADVPQ